MGIRSFSNQYFAEMRKKGLADEHIKILITENPKRYLNINK